MELTSEQIKYLLLIGISYAAAFFINFVIRKILSRYIRRFSRLIRTDPTNFSFIKNSVGFIIYSLATFFIFIKIPYLKSMGTALFASAGILAVVIGFASQKAFSNIISGVFILIFKPFKIADVIAFKDGQKGTVEDITLRHTIIKDYENRRIIIPNSVISEETIINSNIQDEKIRKHLLFSISYSSDLNLAIDIIRTEIMQHRYTIDNRSKAEKLNNEEIVDVRVVELGEYAVILKAYVWTLGNDHAFDLQCDVFKSIKLVFDAQGIEIPFPYRNIIIKDEQTQKKTQISKQES